MSLNVSKIISQQVENKRILNDSEWNILLASDYFANLY